MAQYQCKAAGLSRIDENPGYIVEGRGVRRVKEGGGFGMSCGEIGSSLDVNVCTS